MIFVNRVVILSAAASWQCWRILKTGNEDEKLSDAEVKAFTTRLTVIQVCLGVEAAVTILRLILPLISSHT